MPISLVGREAKAEKVIDQYQQQIETLKAQLKGRLEGKEVSVIWHIDGNFLAPLPNATYFQVLQDVGVGLNPIFLEDSDLTSSVTFSVEVISQYDADILFIGNPDRQPEAFFRKNPLISSLRAAQEQRLYVIEGHVWGTYGPSAINKLIDELSKYLLKAGANIEEKQVNR
ncbi:MAG: ABC transporter substrate-binding protein [Elainella sp. Prado103]|jgi:iron complex transport system substrate-binding protein|nr:ABC transporter substrate-binding protein [Elainella sp. Prado103]